MTMGLAWTFERPFAALLFLLPLAVLLLSFRRVKPRTVWLGTARFFLDEGKKAGAEPRRSVPWARLLAILAMVSGTLAMMAPAPAPLDPGPERFLCAVDRSPSMYLPLGGSTKEGARTRLAVAVSELADALRERARRTGRGIELVWLNASTPASLAIGPMPLSGGLPGDWNAPPRPALQEPDFTAFDRSGTIWVTDHRPRGPGQEAGYISSGGAAVPGVIGTTKAADGSPAALLWSAVPGAAPTAWVEGPASRMAIDPGLPAPLAGLAAIWAADRGVAVVDGSPIVELSIARRAASASARLPGEGDPSEGNSGAGAANIRVARDGWSAQVRAMPESPAGPEGPAANGASPARLAPWLVASNGFEAISTGPGTVRCAIDEFLSPPSDGAAFAVSIASLLDGAILPHPDVVSLAERGAAGERALALPESGLPLAQLDPRTLERLSLETAARAAGWLMGAAALAAALALWLRLRGS